MTTPEERQQYLEQLQEIHALRDNLGLSNTAYRDLLHRLTGSKSAKYMTTEQRQRVITFMRVHHALDEAIELAEKARDDLSEAPQIAPSMMKKVILLDGMREAEMSTSLEEVIATMRELHGKDVQLVEVEEKRSDEGTVLELFFERPAVFLLAQS